MQYPLSFIKEIPKTDLHLHLDGSMRLPTLIELARENNIELPSFTEAGLKEKVFKDTYANLGEYLKGFYYTVNCLCTAEALERVSYELVQDCIADGVRYIEVCLTSNLQTNPTIGDIKNHTLKKMLESRLSITLCTDNLLVSNTTVSREIGLAVNNFDISSSVLKDIIIYGFKRNFYCGSYAEKRDYYRTIIDYYEQIERKYAISTALKQ